MPLYKPSFGHGGYGIVNPSGTHISVRDPSGNIIFEDSKPVKGTEGSKWTFPGDKEIPPGSTFSIDGGAPYTIKDPSMRNEYNPTGGGDPTRVAPETKGGAGGYGGGGSSGVPAGYAPGNIGYGSFPALQNFPGVTLANYSPIATAPYKFTDPTKFAEQYGAASRKEQIKNFDLSKDLALQTLGTELKSLYSFAPAAAALKRSETSIDNQFNQAQRTNQVNQTLPGAVDALNAQAGRAATYASGSLPDSQQDKALELGIRSNAADQATSGGFGATSSAARKVSDLMSADARFKIAQYGESLTTSNINEKASLLLAPTEYSNVGSQINVNPTVSAGQLIPGFTNQINGYASIPATTALASNTQQNQFTTGLEQQTRQFNAGNELNLSEFNTNATNQFALDKFGYQVQYAGAVAGAAQTNTNTGLELQQQQQYQQIAEQLMHQQQQSQQIGGIVSGILGLLGQGSGTSGGSIFSQITNWASSLFGGGSNTPTSGTGFLDPNSPANIFLGSQSGGDFTSTGANPFYSAAGSAIGTYFGLDPQTGAAIGNIAGPTIASGIESIGSSIGHALGF